MRITLRRAGTMALVHVALLGTYCAQLRAAPQQTQTEAVPPVSVPPQETQPGTPPAPAYRPEEKPVAFRVLSTWLLDATPDYRKA